MNISIFGMGYVGCVSGACLAQLGHRVIGIEPNPVKVDLINRGHSPIIEPGLEPLLARTVADGSFRASADWERAVAQTDLALVCVGTPSRPNGSIDLGAVSRVCEQIGQALRSRGTYLTVVIRSTVLPGTVEGTLIPILEKHSGRRAGADFGVCMNPEFLREGTSLEDFRHPPKTVVGELDSRSGEALARLYAPLDAPLRRVPLRVAEMIKYVDNNFHALKVAFANEVGNLCKELGMDSHQVMDLFCLDHKLNLSPYYLKPGFAFGGSCLPKDLRAILYAGRSLDLDLPLLGSVLPSNRGQIQRVASRLLAFKGRPLGVLGLSFKGGTDDLRESPLVELVEFLLGKGFAVRIFDRHVSLARLMGANKEYIERQIPHIASLLVATERELVSGADLILVGNRDEGFKAALGGLRPDQRVFDLVRICGPADVAPAAYEGVAW